MTPSKLTTVKHAIKKIYKIDSDFFELAHKKQFGMLFFIFDLNKLFLKHLTLQ